MHSKRKSECTEVIKVQVQGIQLEDQTKHSATLLLLPTWRFSLFSPGLTLTFLAMASSSHCRQAWKRNSSGDLRLRLFSQWLESPFNLFSVPFKFLSQTGTFSIPSD